MSIIFKKKILENNISILNKRDTRGLQHARQDNFQIPCDITPVRQDNGFINLIVKDAAGQNIPVYITNSVFDQGTAANLSRGLEDYDIVIFIGLGLGYECIETLRSIIKKPRIFIVEPYQDIFQLAIRIVNLTEVFSYDRLDLFVGSAANIEKIIENYQNLIPIGRVRLYTIPSYRLIFGNQLLVLEEKLKNHIRTIRDNWHTTKNNGKQMLSNTITNLPSLFAGAALNKLKDRFKGFPAVCIAAGPSLDSALNSLRKIRQSALLIACDSSVNALLCADIIPHIVVTTDIFKSNFEKVKNQVDQLRDSVLIFGIESNPENIVKFLGHKRIAVSSSSKILLDWLDPKLKLNCRLPSLTSVSQMAIFSALALGADPIVLVGIDLSYHKGYSHSAGSVVQENLNLGKMLQISGVNGDRIFSSPQLVADKVFIEKAISENKTRFISTSLNGALIKGTEIKSFDEILATTVKRNLDVNRILDGIDLPPVANESEAVTLFNEMLDEITLFNDSCACNGKSLNDFITKYDGHGAKDHSADNFKEIQYDFKEFQKKYDLLIGIFEIAIGEEIHEILKKRERIEAKEFKDQIQKIWDEIDIIKDYYQAYSRGADFFYQRLNKITADLKKSESIYQTGIDDNIRVRWNKHLELGRHFSHIEEIWQADREYCEAIRLKPEDPSPWVELVQMYLGSQLWRPARDNIEKAYRLFPNSTEIINLKTDVEDKIQGIMNQIKDAWVVGDKETTRRLLNGYLLLCPDDEQAILLKDVLRELDETLAADSPVVEQQTSRQLPFDELLANASRCIEQLEFEQAIGIIEGLIENFPQKSAALREKLGDIRVLQKDYLSAIWNYEQVMKSDPGETAVIAKIDQAKQQMTLHAQNYRLDQNQAQRATA